MIGKFRNRLILIVILLTAAAAFAFTPSGLLEIHYINVGWGTAVLVIGPDGTRILMDGGRPGTGSGHVVPYMQSINLLPADGLTYMIASHQHSDHIAGLTEVINRGYDVQQAIYYNGSPYSTSYVTAFRNAAATTTAGPIRPMPIGTVIQLGDSATATCVAVNGTVIGHGFVPGSQADENDRSIAILIQYGDFDYLFAGDLGGGENDRACTGRSTDQVNVETHLAQAIVPGGEYPLVSSYGVEILHVNHHGSESSTNADYMNILTPRFACIAVGSGQSADYMFPRRDVVDNVLRGGGYCITATPATVLQNEEGNPAGSQTSYSGYCVGDIIIKTSGEGTYLVDGSGRVTQGPDERASLGLPLTIPFDEPPPAPVVQVVSPNGGEIWLEGSRQTISWSIVDSSGAASYAIDYSTNMGIEWLPIQPRTAGNPQTYSWTVPQTPSPDCVIRVTAWDTSDHSGYDVSDANFIIMEAPDCDYVLGDINGDSLVIGGDITFGVRYFKGHGLPPPDSCYLDSSSAWLYVAGDVNGNCEFRGSDITRLVSYFKGLADLLYCPFFPPPLR